MAFLEWRKFNFFKLETDPKDLPLKEYLQDFKITVTSGGNNHIIIGDSTGQIHIISRDRKIQTFRGYEITIDLACQLRNSSILVTIGQDEPGINPLIKVWDTNRFDKNGDPYCTRISRAIPGNRPVHSSCLCVHDGQQLMAIGFTDGSFVLYRGDITRERNVKQKVFRDANTKVNGLAFKTSTTNIYLFVATENSIIVYNITIKDKETKFHLDDVGCTNNCTIIADTMQENHFMVAKKDAIYCYTVDGKGPCYAIKGEKLILEWFRNYLIIISNSDTVKDKNLITILDIHNKYIVLSMTIPLIQAVVNEWGSFYLIDNENNFYHLDEKDLQSKLSSLFKKNLYDVAIRLAKSQQYDSDSLVDIFIQYGDHLCDKGDYAGAIDQYIKTIGKLEPSYVIRKYLDSQHIEKLTMYLEAFHKQGHATEDHTTLLLHCYTKLNNTVGQADSLKEFILTKENDLNYNVDVAIKVCRYSSPNEALILAKKHEKYDWYIKLLIEDHEKYTEVIDYISSLNNSNAEFCLKKYGLILIDKEPEACTEVIKKVCHQKDLFKYTSDPENFIHLFLHHSEYLVDFLEYLINEDCILSTPVYNTLLEHYLILWVKAENLPTANKYSTKIMKFLQKSHTIKYDESQALVVCHLHSFSDGILYLYENQKLYQQILRHHIIKKDFNSILNCCRRFGNQDSSLWIQALWSCIRVFNKNPPIDLLNDILIVIAKEHLLSPQLVVDALCTNNLNINLGHIRTYLTNELQQEQKKLLENAVITDNYKRDINDLRKKIEELKNDNIIIQRSRCAACHHALELPIIHFLCIHSYHQHCFQSFCDEDNSCPACHPENKLLFELLKAREGDANLHETFHSYVETAHDGFSVTAEYFARGVFNNYKIIIDNTIKNTNNDDDVGLNTLIDNLPDKICIHRNDDDLHFIGNDPMNNYGFGAEAKMRLSENKDYSIIPESESKIRLKENRYSSSLEANISHSSSHLNPFNEDYDESLNPFANDDSKNPFKDDCD